MKLEMLEPNDVVTFKYNDKHPDNPFCDNGNDVKVFVSDLENYIWDCLRQVPRKVEGTEKFQDPVDLEGLSKCDEFLWGELYPLYVAEFDPPVTCSGPKLFEVVKDAFCLAEDIPDQDKQDSWLIMAASCINRVARLNLYNYRTMSFKVPYGALLKRVFNKVYQKGE